MFRTFSLFKPLPFKFIQPAPSFNFGSQIYLKNKSKAVVKRIHQKPIDLRANKERLGLSLDSSSTPNFEPADHQQIFKNEAKPVNKEVHAKSDKNKKLQKDTVETSKVFNEEGERQKEEQIAAEATQSQSTTREKSLSMKLLQAKTKEDVLRMYDKYSLQIKPIHLSVGLFQVIKLLKMEQKLQSMISTSPPSRKSQREISIWEDKNFMEVYNCTLDNIENMNPDSLIRLLATINLKKSYRPEFKALYDRVIDWLAKDQNVLLFDKLQTLKLYIYFVRLASKDFYYNQNNMNIYKLLNSKLRGYVPTYRTKNIIQIYKSCLKYKHPDSKLFVHLNAQVKKRLRYISPKQLISSCAANIACKYDDAEKFVRTTLQHMQTNKLMGQLRLQDLTNLLFLLSEIKSMNVDERFQNECKVLTDYTIRRIANMQIKYIGGIKVNQSQESVEEGYGDLENVGRVLKTIRLSHFDRFLKALIFLGRTDDNIMYFIKTLLKNDYSMTKKEAIAILSFALKYKLTSTSPDSLKDFFFVVYTVLPKLEESLSKVNSEEMNSLYHVLTAILETGDEYVQESVKYTNFSTNFKLALRKFLHLYISGNHKFSLPLLLKEYRFLNKNREVRVGINTKFDVLDFYVRSIRKNIIQPLMVSSMDEEHNPELIKLGLTERQRGNIINSLWILSCLFSKEFPIIDNMAMFQEYAQVISQHFGPEDITNDAMDKLMEIKSLFDQSVGVNPFRDVLDTPEIKSLMERRLQTIQENMQKRRKNVRSEIEIMVKETLKGEGDIKIESCVILKDNIVADLMVTSKHRTYVILMYSHTEDEKMAKIDQYLSPPKVVRRLHSPLKQKILYYKGYQPLFVDIKVWINISEEQKKKEIKTFFSMEKLN